MSFSIADDDWRVVDEGIDPKRVAAHVSTMIGALSVAANVMDAEYHTPGRLPEQRKSAGTTRKRLQTCASKLGRAFGDPVPAPKNPYRLRGRLLFITTINTVLEHGFEMIDDNLVRGDNAAVLSSVLWMAATCSDDAGLLARWAPRLNALHHEDDLYRAYEFPRAPSDAEGAAARAGQAVAEAPEGRRSGA